MKIGLALSGGGIRGFAHAGALKAFEDNNIKVDVIGGTSSGSIVATLYAMGMSPYYIYTLAKKYAKEIVDMGSMPIISEIGNFVVNKKLRISGLNSGESIEAFFNSFSKKRGIKQLSDINMPLVIASVDVSQSQKYIFSSVLPEHDNENYISDIPVGTAIRASCSFPVFFAPCKFKNHLFMDGGILDNTPAKEIQKYGVDKIISIKFDSNQVNGDSNIMDIGMKILDIMGNKISEEDLKISDLILTIPTDGTGLLDTENLDLCYKEGYNTVINNINKIKEICAND